MIKNIEKKAENNNVTILKVGAQTRLTALNTSICERLKNDGLVVMDCIGEKALFQQKQSSMQGGFSQAQ